ncbi:hypothetical protein [Thermogemmatispora tikiterensis]|nr:hypothetical protein [Thermogemmatispora tikiterensis]
MEEERLISFIQGLWLDAQGEADALAWFLPAASLITRHPDLSPALFEACG